MIPANIHESHLGYFATVSGKWISLIEPDIDMVDYHEIIGAMSKYPRFGGHIQNFYSLAQHSLMVAELAPPELKLEAICHDMTEGYLGDVIKPLKIILGRAYGDVEKRFERLIVTKYKLDAERLEMIKPFDMKALEIEHEWLRKSNLIPWQKSGIAMKPYYQSFDFWRWKMIEEFRLRYKMRHGDYPEAN